MSIRVPPGLKAAFGYTCARNTYLAGWSVVLHKCAHTVSTWTPIAFPVSQRVFGISACRVTAVSLVLRVTVRARPEWAGLPFCGSFRLSPASWRLNRGPLRIPARGGRAHARAFWRRGSVDMELLGQRLNTSWMWSGSPPWVFTRAGSLTPPQPVQ